MVCLKYNIHIFIYIIYIEIYMIYLIYIFRNACIYIVFLFLYLLYLTNNLIFFFFPVKLMVPANYDLINSIVSTRVVQL